MAKILVLGGCDAHRGETSAVMAEMLHLLHSSDSQLKGEVKATSAAQDRAAWPFSASGGIVDAPVWNLHVAVYGFHGHTAAVSGNGFHPIKWVYESETNIVVKPDQPSTELLAAVRQVVGDAEGLDIADDDADKDAKVCFPYSTIRTPLNVICFAESKLE